MTSDPPLTDETQGRIAPTLSSLTVTGFRNYTSARLELTDAPVVLFGDNGSGKTNLLEAVSFLSPGRGLRRATFEAAAKAAGDGSWAIAARAETPSGTIAIGTGYQIAPGGGERRRVTRIDGETVPSSDALTDILRVLWLTPAMDGLFTGPAGDRRRHLDRMVLAIDPQHGRRYTAFEKAMRGRNRLLEDNVRDDSWLGAQEAQMAELGTAIAAARLDLVSRFLRYMEALGGSGPFPTALLALEGSLEAALMTGNATVVEDEYRDRLAAERYRDRAAGRTLEGPHRSDLLVTHGAKEMPAALCSTGEQKALLLGLTLSHARLVAEITGIVPLLLLDEVAAHLDSSRRAALVDELGKLGGQSWLTGTDRSLFAALEGRAQFFQVADARVEHVT